MTRKKEPTIIPQLAIVGMGREGLAYGVNESGRKIYVENGTVGDRGVVQVFKRMKGASLGKIIDWHERSSQRIEPICEHFSLCGGCKWQFVDYAQQLIWKQQFIEEEFRELTDLAVPPVVPSPQIYFYRNKLEFSATNDRWLNEIEQGQSIASKNALGYHVPNRWARIFDVCCCHLQPDPSNAIRQFVKELAEKLGIDFYDLHQQTGTLRNLIVRTSSMGELMVILSFYPTQNELQLELLDQLLAKFPQITSLYSVQNSKGNDTIYDCSLSLYAGKPYIIEKLGELEFAITPKSFFQVNCSQANRLVQIVKDFSQITPDQIVYDLYCGTGTIALSIAHLAKQVIGIELVEDAIKDAKFNAELNHISNVNFLVGDMKDIFQSTTTTHYGKPDLVITDPPRSGMMPIVIQQLLAILPTKIIYVSCNPATQARDIKLLTDKYQITNLQALDMFPQTAHVENIVALELKS
jgi:23S rRNA (uracil1939-C5)-methyltransferase